MVARCNSYLAEQFTLNRRVCSAACTSSVFTNKQLRKRLVSGSQNSETIAKIPMHCQKVLNKSVMGNFDSMTVNRRGRNFLECDVNHYFLVLESDIGTKQPCRTFRRTLTHIRVLD